jgi:rare lipoprotein A
MANSTDLRRMSRLSVVLMAGASLAACASMTPRYPSQARGPQGVPPAQGEYKVGKPYQVGGIWYVPREQPNYDETGIASWYGDQFHMKATANGETFDMARVSAAHTTLPLPSLVEVTNLDNGRKLVVRVNDRGPFVGNRIIDLSREAARQLGYDRQGLARVRVRYVGPAPLLGPDGGLRYANAKPYPTHIPPTPPALRAATPGVDPAMELAAATPRAAPVSAPIVSESLPPITGSAISSAPIPPAPLAAPTATATATTTVNVAIAATSSALRIQAGAFSSEVNAQRAVSQLSAAGNAVIEPLQRDGLTFYRVVLPAPEDEAAAYALRDRVAEIGFADARVVRTF